jgi:hypothetical protein
MAPNIFIFSIAMDANYPFEVKNVEIWAPAFLKHYNSFIATVDPLAGFCSYVCK